ncbi:ATP-binding protein [Streptantibioticus ferralitis]|uniref:ATP-binding protein n=1 Tax=Streptantibioticus ferralitis TaxID=236510 RepID=A0ABT5ZC73_9ACTN|nr:ATP-binding protein [Streptantibioticus ferralitis]MDF2261447.1 ATP-binding protein [Streptantibioticus ferralitis]
MNGSERAAVATPIDADYLFPVPHIREAVATVRRRAHTLLADWGVPADSLEDALLVISELITNAILHALPPAVLRLCWSETEGRPTLRVEVTDGGPVPRPRPCAEEMATPDEHGRGLAIVTALSVRHGTHARCGGVVRWADLPVS